jgi:hypothetical protein
MLLEVLDRPGDGCAGMKQLLTDNDEPRAAQRRLIRNAIAMYRSLVAAGVVERLAEPDEMGRRVRITVDLQDDFALNHPLSLFVLEAIPRLDRSSPEWDLDVISVVESTLEDPWAVLQAQLERLRTETLARLKEEGMEYEDRIEVLRELEHPKPLAEFLYEVFDSYRVRHPWARDHNVRPKSIVRDMYEQSMSFAEYVAHYGTARSEGLLLRYLSEAYKALAQNVPEEMKSQALRDISEWLGEMVRQVDSSLLDEWELLSHPERAQEALARGGRPGPGPALGAGPAPLTANVRAFRVMVRNACFRRAELAAKRDWSGLGELDHDAGWDDQRWEAAFAEYFADHVMIGTGLTARGAALWQVAELGRTWRARQVLDDPEGYHEWAIVLDIGLDASDQAGEPAVRPVGVERL